MYRTNHLLRLLALPALLLLAACADDTDTQPAAEPADTLAGQPVRFTATGLAVTPAGTPQTRATLETDFPAEGSTMTVYMTGDGNTWQEDYTFNGTTWEADGEPLLWPDTQNTYTFNAISPAGTDPEITLPTEWTAETLAEYEEIRATAEANTTTATQSLALPLRHALVKVQVISISGQPVTLTTTTADGTEFMTLYSPDNGVTYEGYVLPSKTGFGFLTDQVYTVDKELEAGTVVTTCDLEGGTVIACPQQGRLSEVWTGNPQKMVITGTLDATDMSTINGHKGEITHLYVMGGSISGDEDWKNLNMSGATQLESVYLAEATSINDGAFQNCSELTSVSLPKAKSIGNDAFQSCSALASVSLPQAESIGIGAFFQCSELTSVSLPQAKSIGNNAFQECNALTSISLPQAESIGFDAFRQCSELTSVSLPEAKSIDGNAFFICSKLESICLPKNATIDINSFLGCHNLKTLFLSDENATEEEAIAFISKISTLTTIHYGYIGTDGDYLKESNYAHHWPTN